MPLASHIFIFTFRLSFLVSFHYYFIYRHFAIFRFISFFIDYCFDIFSLYYFHIYFVFFEHIFAIFAFISPLISLSFISFHFFSSFLLRHWYYAAIRWLLLLIFIERHFFHWLIYIAATLFSLFSITSLRWFFAAPFFILPRHATPPSRVYAPFHWFRRFFFFDAAIDFSSFLSRHWYFAAHIFFHYFSLTAVFIFGFSSFSILLFSPLFSIFLIVSRHYYTLPLLRHYFSLFSLLFFQISFFIFTLIIDITFHWF